MSQEQLEILRMLSEGKISLEEAEMLLRAVGNTSDASERPGMKDTKREMGAIFQEIGREIGKAVGSVQKTDVGKIVSKVVEEVKESVPHKVEQEIRKTVESVRSDLSKW